jgi:hypothetical protein
MQAQAKLDCRAAKQLSGVPPPLSASCSSAYSGALGHGKILEITEHSLHRPERVLVFFPKTGWNGLGGSRHLIFSRCSPLLILEARCARHGTYFQNRQTRQGACFTASAPLRAAPLDRLSASCREATTTSHNRFDPWLPRTHQGPISA